MVDIATSDLNQRAPAAKGIGGRAVERAVARERRSFDFGDDCLASMMTDRVLVEVRPVGSRQN
jgi:hypothetical protein